MDAMLEATMLLCFGFSWPINLFKNIKARSAKAMSLPFILLIVVGYIAGIAAKLVKVNMGIYQIDYVFWVYIFNLVMVSGNIAVYFRNLALDKKAGIAK